MVCTVYTRPRVVDEKGKPLQFCVVGPNRKEQLCKPSTPTLQRFDRLLRALYAAELKFDSGNDRLGAVCEALEGVIKFLHEDSVVILSGITGHLATLTSALVDMKKGINSGLLVPTEKVRNRPGGSTFDAVRGQLAGALDLLTRSGMSRSNAEIWLANLIADQGLILPRGSGSHRPGGGPIRAKLLGKWLDKARGRNPPPELGQMFKLVQKRYSCATPEAAQRQCWVLVRSCTALFPRTPRVRGKDWSLASAAFLTTERGGKWFD
jgi:hypothetical protein